jgi:hypothetical protein
MKFPKRVRIEHGPNDELKVFDGDSGEELAVSGIRESRPPMAPRTPSFTQATVTVTFLDEAGRRHRREYPATRVQRVRREEPGA